MSNADEIQNGTRITVIGVGNGGVNAVNHMISRQHLHAEFICVDTDARALARCGSCRTFQLGASGLGAASPIRGRQAAELSVDRIRKAIDGTQMLFIIAGMSGGTGTGAAPVIACVGREMGILTVGVATTPCEWEGSKRMKNAEAGLAELKSNVDSLIVLPLERLIEMLGDDLTQDEFLTQANDLMSAVVSGLAGMHTWEDILDVQRRRQSSITAGGIMTQKNLNDVLGELWKNWAFRLSLSSNELFHSNILQYLVESNATPLSASSESSKPPDGNEREECLAANSNLAHSRDDSGDESEPTLIHKESAVRLLNVLCGDKHIGCVPAFNIMKDANFQFSVQREWKNMDLVILRSPKGAKPKWLPIYALEVKVKAYPELKQVHRYRDILNEMWEKEDVSSSKPYTPPLFLLTGMGASAFKNCKINALYLLNFKELAEGLKNQECDVGLVAEQYIALCELLHNLFELLEGTLTSKTKWKSARDTAKQLEPYRLHSLSGKLWASHVAKQFRDRVNANKKIATEYVHYYSGYTRTSNSGICWKWAIEEESISIGVQIEGESVRLFLNIVHPSLGSALEARKKVEKTLLKLMKSHGVFAENPGMPTLQKRWNSIDRSSDFHWLGFTIPVREASASSSGNSALKLFVEGKVGKGRGDRMLTGYANGPGNGFADVRLTLRDSDDCTIDAVSEMVSSVLVNDLFSSSQRTEDQDPLLLRVVKGFEAAHCRDAVTNWIENPELSPWPSPTST